MLDFIRVIIFFFLGLIFWFELAVKIICIWDICFKVKEVRGEDDCGDVVVAFLVVGEFAVVRCCWDRDCDFEEEGCVCFLIKVLVVVVFFVRFFFMYYSLVVLSEWYIRRRRKFLLIEMFIFFFRLSLVVDISLSGLILFLITKDVIYRLIVFLWKGVLLVLRKILLFFLLLLVIKGRSLSMKVYLEFIFSS